MATFFEYSYINVGAAVEPPSPRAHEYSFVNVGVADTPSPDAVEYAHANVTDPPPFSVWHASQYGRQSATFLGWWDGTAIQSANLLGWWDGTGINSVR